MSGATPNSGANFYPGFVPLDEDWERLFSGKVDAYRGILTNPSVVGDLTLGQSPSSDLHAASKAYVDSVVGGGGPGGGIPDAPADGTPYCRLNHTWTPAPTLLTGNVVGDMHVSGGLYSATIATTGDTTVGAALHVVGGTIDQGQGGTGIIMIGCDCAVTGTLTVIGNASVVGSLSVAGNITGAALNNLFASPPPIGNVLPNTGIFTTTGGTPFTLLNGPQATAGAGNGTLFRIVSSVGGNSRASIETYANSQPAWIGRAAGGTPTAPLAVLTDQVLVNLNGWGWGTTGFVTAGGVQVRAAQTFTDAAAGSYLQFLTNPIGSNTPLERMRVTDAGALQIGTGTQNILTFTPGATTAVASRLASSASGNGGIEIGGTAVSLGSSATGTLNNLLVVPGIGAVNTLAIIRTGTGPVQMGFPIVLGSGVNNFLTIAPGATATGTITLTATGTGDIGIGGTSRFIVGVANASLMITPGATPFDPTQFDTAGGLKVNGPVRFSGTTGFNNANPIAKPTLTGAWAGNAAGKALATLLASYGLLTDSSTA